MYYAELDGVTNAEVAGADLRASALDAEEQIAARMTKSESYRGDFDQTSATTDKRMSTTFFYGTKGDEIADYSHNYKLFGTGAGTDVKTTSYMYYAELDDITDAEVAGSDLRASALDAQEQIAARMTKSESYRGDFDQTSATIDKRMSTTYFEGNKGEEISDYTHNYKTYGSAAGTDVNTVVVYFYKDTIERAGASDDMSPLIWVNTYKYNDQLDTPSEIDAVTSGYDTAIISRTVNSIEDSLGYERYKGEELADHTITYRLKKDPSGAYSPSEEKTIGVYFYGDSTSASKRAVDADSADDLTGQINTYKYCDLYDTDVERDSIVLADREALMSITYNNLREAGASEDRFRGDEVADHTIGFGIKKNSSGDYIDSEEKTVSVYFYGDSSSATARAEDVSSEDLTGQINTYKYCDLYDTAPEIEGITVSSDTALMTATYNNLREAGASEDRQKGEEIADWTYNYHLKKTGTSYISSVLRTTTLYHYEDPAGGDDPVRAENAGPDTPLRKQTVYKNDFISLPADPDAIRFQEIFFVGDKNEETTDYSLNYTYDQEISLSTVYFYGDSMSRASDPSILSTDEPLRKTETYRLDPVDPDTGVIDPDAIKLSETINFGDERGEEIADYTRTYSIDRFSGSADVISTTVFRYDTGAGDPFERADNAGVTVDSALRAQIVYNGDTTAGTPISMDDSTTQSAIVNIVVPSDDIVNVARLDGDKGEEKNTWSVDRKGVVQDYSYEDKFWTYSDVDSGSGPTGDENTFDEVTRVDVSGNGYSTYYEVNRYNDSQVKYTMDYKGTITTYIYDADEFLESTTYSTDKAVFAEDGTGAVSVATKVTETFFERNEDSFWEPRAKYALDGENTVTAYFYHDVSRDQYFTLQFEEVDVAETTPLAAGPSGGANIHTFVENMTGITSTASPEDSLETSTYNSFIPDKDVDPVKITKSYSSKNDYGEIETAMIIQPNGLFVYYNYEEITDLSYPDPDLRFRTLMSRTTSWGSLSSFDSITILDMYGNVSVTVGSGGVSQHHRFMDPGMMGSGVDKRESVTDAIYYYDTNGKLLRIEQTEVKSYQIQYSVGTPPDADTYTQTKYLDTDIVYTYDYKTDPDTGALEIGTFTDPGGTGETIEAAAISKGEYASSGDLYNVQYFDDEMRLVETWAKLPTYDDDGIYTGDVWGRSQVYTYVGDPDDDASGTTTDLLSALSVIGSFRGEIDDMGDDTITVNGIAYKANTGGVEVIDEDGSEIEWGDLLAEFLTEEARYVRILGTPGFSVSSPGTATRIEVVTDIGRIQSADFTNDTIKINDIDYTVSPESLEIIDENREMIPWDGEEGLENIYTAHTDAGLPTYIWISAGQDNLINRIGLAFGSIRIGGVDARVTSSTMIYDLEGTEINIQQMSSLLSEDPEELYIRAQSSKVGGMWVVDRIDLVGPPETQTLGIAGEFNDLGGISAVTDVLVSANTADNTIQAAGASIKVLDRTVIADSRGDAIDTYETASEKVDYLESIRNNYEAQGIFEVLKIVAMREGGEWVAEHITIANDLPTIGNTVLTGSISEVNENKKTLTFGGVKMNYGNAFLEDIEGNSIYLASGDDAALNAVSDVLNDNGGAIYARIRASMVRGEWNINRIKVISDISGNASISGDITSIDPFSDTVTARGQDIEIIGSVTVAGKSIFIPDQTDVMKDEKGNSVTVDQLSNIFDYNSSYMEATAADVDFFLADDGSLVLSDLSVRPGRHANWCRDPG